MLVIPTYSQLILSPDLVLSQNEMHSGFVEPQPIHLNMNHVFGGREL